MTQIDNLTNQADQVTQVVLDDGSVMQLELVFQATTQRWTVNVSHPQITINGLNLCVGANVLRTWRNVITFGLACNTTDGADPFDIEDLVNGRAQLYSLNAADVQAVEANVYGGVLQ